ncbi:glycosyltransferase [Microbaculum marinum]|uniref:Glycosyltransferase n=1 Tax=Microbaculum marinum TaxID=1764581 RepID=A0AAW9RVL6_9HYPH
MDLPTNEVRGLRTEIVTGRELPSRDESELLLSEYVRPDVYLSENGLEETADAVRHYLDTGWSTGCLPNLWFNAVAYETDLAGALANVSPPLLRFAIRARVDASERARVLKFTSDRHARKLLRPFFDREYYRDRYRDVVGQRMDPLLHYMRIGWREGRDPSAWFSTRFYRQAYRDVRDAQVNPLLHYAVFGQGEGRRTNALGAETIQTPELPSKEDWERIFRRNAPHHRLDVVVPVYRGYRDTLACIYSVLTSANRTDFNLIVVNDASPEPELAEALRELAGRGLFDLIENEQNEGFVRSVTKGMLSNPDNDIVLLNSDAVVSGNWIDRLRYHAKSGRAVATVTPFSNNATICSYPLANSNNSYRLEIASSELDKLCKQTNRGKSIRIPVGVGFCMWINRDAIDRVGLFDTENFARGYGEEVDFCMRCVKAGLHNLQALDVFVQHTGEVSFQKTAIANRRAGERAVDLKHPEFQGRVRRFVDVDPSREAREALDWSRFARHFRGRCAVFVLHDMGGGIETNARDLADALSRQGIDVLALRIVRESIATVRFEQYSVAREIFCPNIGELSVLQGEQQILDILKALKPKFVHVHSVARMHIRAVDRLFAVLRNCGANLYYTWHDYTPFCPRNSFVDAEGQYCNEEVGERCVSCIRQRPAVSEAGGDPARWRRVFERFLGSVHTQILPNPDVASRAELLPRTGQLRVRPHPETGRAMVRFTEPPHDRTPIRIATVGAIGPHKGSDVLMALARDARLRSLPIEYLVIGYTDYRGQGPVAETGEYGSDGGAILRLMEYRPHFALLPSICPETYGYALSLALQVGLPPIVFDIGALAQRLTSIGAGIVLPYEYSVDTQKINDHILQLDIAETWSKMTGTATRGDTVSISDYYGLQDDDTDAPDGAGGARRVRKRHRLQAT